MKIGRFYGKIIDSITNKPVEFASVQLLVPIMYDSVSKSMKENVVLAGQLTEVNGDFSLSKINMMGKYKLKISAIGYATREFPVSFGIKAREMKPGGGEGMRKMLSSADKDLGNIKLRPQATQLKEVEVVTATPVLELKLDKKVFNVEKNMASAGGTAEDVLKQVPSVTVDMDGNVSVRNTSPQIFVDGKETTLSLDQIPADAIASVEIISNPSAKYDAAGGGAGILNIVLKKEKRVGYNGNIQAGINQRGKINGMVNLNMRENKINAFALGNFNQRSHITEGTTERYNLLGSPLTNIFQTQQSVINGLFMFTQGGIDWFKDNRNTFTLSGRYLRGKFEPEDEITTTTDTLLQSDISSSSYNRASETNRQFQNLGGTFQYKHLYPKEGKELTADVNYNKSVFEWGGNYGTQYFDENHFPVGDSVLQTWNGNGYNEILSAQTDYVHPLNGKSKIEAGAKGSYRNFWSKTENFLKDNNTGEYLLITNQSSNYKFVDHVYAAYFLYSRQREKTGYQAGIRTESSFYTGELVDSNKTFRNYFPASLFPNFSVSYKVKEDDQLQLSYSRRVSRPSFFQLIPYIDYSDSLNLRKGNAGLKPQFTHNAELSFLKTINNSNNVLAAVYFSNTTGIITNYQNMEYDTVLQKNVIISTYKNADMSYVYGGEITSKSVAKTRGESAREWMEFTLNFNGYYSVLDAENIQQGLQSERFSWFAKANLTFKFLKNFSVQLSPEYRSRASVPVSRGDNQQQGGGGWQQSPTSTAQGYIKERWGVDASVKYEFLKNKTASLTVSMRDIFASDIVETVTESDYFNQTSTRLRDPQFVKVNFSYRFGKFDASLFKRKNTRISTEGMDMGM